MNGAARARGATGRRQGAGAEADMQGPPISIGAEEGAPCPCIGMLAACPFIPPDPHIPAGRSPCA